MSALQAAISGALQRLVTLLIMKDTIGIAILSFVERLCSFTGECVYMSTFGLSFVGRFVLFQSVLYQRFYCRVALPSKIFPNLHL